MASSHDAKLTIQEFKSIAKELQTLNKKFSGKERKSILGKGAEVVQHGIKSEAPIHHKKHTGYDSGKTAGKQNARTFRPGTLKNATQIFTTRRTRDVFVGVIGRKASSARKVLGYKFSKAKNKIAYYWTFVYYGTKYKAANKFIDRGYAKTKAKSESVLKKAVQDAVRKWINQKGFK